MRYRAVYDWYFEHAAFGGFKSLSDGLGNLIRFTETETYAAIAIAHNYNGAKGEAASAFNYFSDSADVNDLVNQLKLARFNCYQNNVSLKYVRAGRLKIQAGFPCSVG